VSIALLLETAETVGPPRVGFWTAREVVILKAVYPTAGVPGCLERLPGRSPGAIYQQAAGLHLKSPRTSHPKSPPALSSDDIDRLICRTCQTNPDSGAIKALARTIGRTRQWIRTRAIKLGVAVPRFAPLPWSSAETDIVVENAHLSPIALKRRLLKAGFAARTEAAIAGKIRSAGVSTEDPDHYTANGLAKLFGVDVHVVTGWISRGWLRAQRRGTARLEQQGGDQWWISRWQVRCFVRDSVQVIDFRKLDKVWLVELLTDPDIRQIGVGRPHDYGAGDFDGPRGPGGGRTKVWTMPKGPQDRLAKELATDDARELAHWLNDLNDDDSHRVFVEMRRQNLKTKQQRLASRGIPAGAAAFDDMMEAEVRRDFLARIRTGSTPEDAADIAKQVAETRIARDNAERPSDIHWQRSREAYASIADLLVISMRAALVGDTVLRPASARYAEAPYMRPWTQARC
jgi:hypothetical protein